MMDHRCHCTLVPLKEAGLSPSGRKLMTGGNRQFPHRLPYRRADISTVQIETAERMSISGVQDKISMRLQRGQLLPVDRGGEYILKPVPSRPLPRFGADVPANEHLTMQMAAQIFGIPTAANACLCLADGSMAYVVKRFDRSGDTKIPQEDFCQLSARSPESHGKSYKYDGTYEELGRVLRKHCAAYAVEVEKLYRLIVFNYVFSNGDAHLKNFSLQQSPYGDYILTPAYDLVCTSLHIPNESRTALGLFEDFESETYRRNGFYGTEDFLHLAELFGIQEKRAAKILSSFPEQHDRVVDLTGRSFLSDGAKADYLSRYEDRLLALRPAR